MASLRPCAAAGAPLLLLRGRLGSFGIAASGSGGGSRLGPCLFAFAWPGWRAQGAGCQVLQPQVGGRGAKKRDLVAVFQRGRLAGQERGPRAGLQLDHRRPRPGHRDDDGALAIAGLHRRQLLARHIHIVDSARRVPTQHRGAAARARHGHGDVRPISLAVPDRLERPAGHPGWLYGWLLMSYSGAMRDGLGTINSYLTPAARCRSGWPRRRVIRAVFRFRPPSLLISNVL